MPVRTAIVAAAGAVTGAVATALILKQQSSATSTPRVAPTAIPPPIIPAGRHTRPSPTPPRNDDDGPRPVDPSGIFQYGFAGPISDLATRQAFVSAYDRRTRNPAWVAEHITADSLATRKGDRKLSQFVEDESIPEPFRAKLNDYFRSGYDRGHQAPAADAKWSQTAMNETFFLSNMCPQVGSGFNRDYWAHFEDFCRRLTTKYPSVRIITGPLYLPKREADGKWRVNYEVVGSPPNVAVPTHFFKVLLAEDGKTGGNVAVGAFVLPNAPISNAVPLREFEVPVEVVERAAGLEFLGKLDLARRKRLCDEVQCDITVREFKKEARKDSKL